MTKKTGTTPGIQYRFKLNDEVSLVCEIVDPNHTAIWVDGPAAQEGQILVELTGLTPAQALELWLGDTYLEDWDDMSTAPISMPPGDDAWEFEHKVFPGEETKAESFPPEMCFSRDHALWKLAS